MQEQGESRRLNTGGSRFFLPLLLLGGSLLCCFVLFLFDIRGFILTRIVPIPEGIYDDSINASIEYRGWWRTFLIQQETINVLNFYREELTKSDWQIEVREGNDNYHCIKATKYGVMTAFIEVFQRTSSDPDDITPYTGVFIKVPPRKSICQDQYWSSN
jgi:hypothetical protein